MVPLNIILGNLLKVTQNYFVLACTCMQVCVSPRATKQFLYQLKNQNLPYLNPLFPSDHKTGGYTEINSRPDQAEKCFLATVGFDHVTFKFT